MFTLLNNKIKSIINKQFVKDTFFVAFSNFLNSITSFLKGLFIAGYFGATRSTDNYVYYQVFPLLVMSIFGGAIGESCLPLFKSILNKARDELYSLYKDLEGVVISVTIFVIICSFFLTLILNIKKQGNFSQHLFIPVIFYLAILPGSVAAVCNSYFLANNQAKIIANVNILSNLFSLLLSIGLSFVIGIYGFVIGWTTNHMLRYVLLRTKIGIELKFITNRVELRDSWLAVKEIFIIAFPIMIASSIEKLYLLVDRTFAYNLKGGRLSNLYFAGSLSDLPITILISAVGYIAYPKLFDWINESTEKVTIEKFQKFIIYLMTVSSIFVILMSFVPDIIVNVIYERGKYTSADRIISSNCLQLLTIGFVSKVLYISLARVLYIIKRQKEIIFITLIPLIAKFIGNIMFINKFEVYTIAATTSLANILMLWLLVFKLNTPKFPVWSIVGEMKIISIYILLTVLPAAKFFFVNKIN